MIFNLVCQSVTPPTVRPLLADPLNQRTPHNRRPSVQPSPHPSITPPSAPPPPAGPAGWGRHPPSPPYRQQSLPHRPRPRPGAARGLQGRRGPAGNLPAPGTHSPPPRRGAVGGGGACKQRSGSFVGNALTNERTNQTIDGDGHSFVRSCYASYPHSPIQPRYVPTWNQPTKQQHTYPHPLEVARLRVRPRAHQCLRRGQLLADVQGRVPVWVLLSMYWSEVGGRVFG